MLLAALGNLPLSALHGLGEVQTLRSGRFDDPPTIGPGKGMPPKKSLGNRSDSYPCPGHKTHKCGKRISGNKDRCLNCVNLKRADEQDLWMMYMKGEPGSPTQDEISTGPWTTRENVFESVRISRRKWPLLPCWAQRVFPNGQPEYRGEDNPDRLP